MVYTERQEKRDKQGVMLEDRSQWPMWEGQKEDLVGIAVEEEGSRAREEHPEDEQALHLEQISYVPSLLHAESMFEPCC